MAEVVGPDTPPLIKNKGGRPPTYPWDEWLRHNVTQRLIEGIDFTSLPTSMRHMAYAQAQKRGGTAKVTMGKDILDRNVVEVTFQFDASTLRRHEEELARIDEEEDLFPNGRQQSRP